MVWPDKPLSTLSLRLFNIFLLRSPHYPFLSQSTLSVETKEHPACRRNASRASSSAHMPVSTSSACPIGTSGRLFEMTGKTTRPARWTADSSPVLEDIKLTDSADAPGRRRPQRCQHTCSPWCCDPDRAEDRHSPDHAHGHWKAWKGVSTTEVQSLHGHVGCRLLQDLLWRMTSARSREREPTSLPQTPLDILAVADTRSLPKRANVAKDDEKTPPAERAERGGSPRPTSGSDPATPREKKVSHPARDICQL